MTITTSVPGSAVAHYVENQRITRTRSTIREVLRRTRAGHLTEQQASQILCAAGIGVTQVQVEDAINWMDDVESPAARLDRIEFDEGPVKGDRVEVLARLQSVAQSDLDALIDRAARLATSVDSEEAVLAVVGILAAAA